MTLQFHSSLYIHSRETQTYVPGHIYANARRNVVFSNQKLKQPKYPATTEWIYKSKTFIQRKLSGS